MAESFELLDCGAPEGGCRSEEESSQLVWSPELFCFFGRGESPGVSERFSPRDGILLSVSAVEAAELDMRRES